MGETALMNIIVPFDFTFEDKAATEKFRLEESLKIKKQYKTDPLVRIRVEHKLNKIFEYLKHNFFLKILFCKLIFR